ncbi:MAG: hypothetical protein H6755_00800 [Candidatus Omnitrophica bacterium]|nr:hypothetical protein [Candidatus Omnitrophota bacterium]
MNKRLFIIGILCALLWGYISLMTKGFPQAWVDMLDNYTGHTVSKQIQQMVNGFHYDTRNNVMPTAAFLTLFYIIFAMVFYLIIAIQKREAQTGSLLLVVFFSLVFRVILLFSVPIHENDIYRYMWDGKVFKSEINPYKYSPSDLFMYENKYKDDFYDGFHEVTLKAKEFEYRDQERLDTLLKLRDQNQTNYERIGHWQVPTIYPPMAQLVFLLAAKLKVDHLIFLKGIFILFDLGVLVLIIGILKCLNKNPCLSLIYGWSPLVLKEFANSGHYDPIVIFFTMFCLYLFLKTNHKRSSLMLALAVLSKFFSGVLLPILGRYWSLIHLVIFSFTILLLYVPFFIWNDAGIAGVFEGLRTYNEQWSYNSSIFAGIYVLLKQYAPNFTETLWPAKMIVGGIYLFFLIILVVWKAPQATRINNKFVLNKNQQLIIMHRCFLAVAVLFIINPVGDPWYFCWVIPFLCIFPYKSWLLLSGLLAFSYINFQSDYSIVGARFLDISLTTWIIYTPFFLYFFIENIFRPSFVLDMKKNM